MRHAGYFADGVVESRFVRFRGPGKAGKLADELKSGSADFVIGCGWLEIVEGLDVPAHENSSSSKVNGEMILNNFVLSKMVSHQTAINTLLAASGFFLCWQ
jgi:hypothetical protein